MNVDFTRIEQAFRFLAAIRSPWRRRLALDAAAVGFGCTRSAFRAAFKEWEIEQAFQSVAAQLPEPEPDQEPEESPIEAEGP